MFSSRARLTKRTGKNPTGRYDFLKLLVTEYTTTSSKDAQEQVLANLANFAYDPVNYGYMRQLKVIDIFLNALSQSNPKLVRFGIGGLCNLCLDGINKLYILRNQGVELISSLLSSEDEDVLLGVITTLMFLITPESVNEITSPRIIKRMLELSDPSYEHRRVKNVATLFLNDFCETSAIEKVKTENQSLTCNIESNIMKLIQFFAGFLKNHSVRTTKIRSFADTTMNNLREGDQVSVLKIITNDDILKFAELTGDHNPIHTESARNIAHGALLNGLVSGLIGTKLPGAGTIVIEQNITFPKPCYAGDTVEVIVKITSNRIRRRS
ncbi:PREDICTED: armadillo repeat-containing protein 7 [Atta cephalotes]|uniref:MaoC-like domain-containing protein n=1 Tax=Atta cephalotes TaxID=12957 RepID=A0A158NCT3_ATTCE|nr:PREDICTED: armadillo repeat-containing protein 7 [Atta cephalotes]